MRSFVRIVLGLCIAGAGSLGCTSIIGLKAPPQQDASAPSSSDEGGAGTDATMQMMTTPDGGNASDTGLGEAANPNGSINGVTCAANSDCQSGFCTDGVCCNNACAGTCEKCSLTGSVGTCSPIPANTDPEMECVPVVSDAGVTTVADASPTTVDSGEGGAGGDAGADADGGPSGDASADASGDAGAAGGDAGDAGQALNLPDGGYTSTASTCYGACDGNGGNGKGACVYPGATKTCGTQFCNANDQAAGFACDGNGSCNLGFSTCNKYACTGDACGTTCTIDSECLSGYYCAGGTCQPTLGLGQVCSVPSQCSSGFCSKGVANTGTTLVCCTSDCTIPGGTCLQSAALQGQCECSVSCPGGSCQVYYQDLDGDTYGNKDGDPTGGGTLAAATFCRRPDTSPTTPTVTIRIPTRIRDRPPTSRRRAA
jgi:hypothetical protein